MDIYRAAKWRGKFPPLATDTVVNNNNSLYTGGSHHWKVVFCEALYANYVTEYANYLIEYTSYVVELSK